MTIKVFIEVQCLDTMLVAATTVKNIVVIFSMFPMKN